MIVSTHSRLKAAGKSILRITNEIYCFNTQPPEGGWLIIAKNRDGEMGFNTQPPEGGWVLGLLRISHNLGFNTQPPEGGWK